MKWTPEAIERLEECGRRVEIHEGELWRACKAFAAEHPEEFRIVESRNLPPRSRAAWASLGVPPIPYGGFVATEKGIDILKGADNDGKNDRTE